MNLTPKFFFVLAALFLFYSNGNAKVFSCVAQDEQYHSKDVRAQIRFYSLSPGGDSVFTPWFPSEKDFTQDLSLKSGAQISTDSLRWNIPLPAISSDDIVDIKFQYKSVPGTERLKTEVSVIPYHRARYCSYDIPGIGDDFNRLMLMLPEKISDENLRPWKDSCMTLSTAYAEKNGPLIRISAFTGTKGNYQPCDTFSLRIFYVSSGDTVYQPWILIRQGELVHSPFSRSYMHCQVRVANRIFSGYTEESGSGGYSDYNRYEFYFDPSSPSETYIISHYSAHGHFSYSEAGDDTHVLKVFLSDSCEANKEREPSRGSRFVTPVFAPPFYFLQAGISLAPFVRYAGIQFKHETGEEGIFLVDHLLGARYYFRTKSGTKIFAEDAAFTTNLAMGALRFGLGTSAFEDKEQFGWSLQPMLGISTGGIDLMMSYNFFLLHGKQFPDVQRFNLTLYIGPLLRKFSGRKEE